MDAASGWLTRRDAVVTSGLSHATDLVIVSAKGAELTDATGRVFLDFAGGIGVMNVGHCDPKVVEAIKAQAEQLLHVSIQLVTYPSYIELCEELVRVLPHGERTKCLLVNTGAEAVENAIKIARQATGRGAVICFGEAFHGRTLLAATLTSKINYKTGCGPFAPDIHRLPFPDTLRGEGTPSDVVERELARLRHAFKNTVAASDVAAIIIELVQGEGGFRVAPKAYIQGLREICDEHGIVLIFDEVQTGFARTGAWGAYEHYGVTPDLSTWAKSMGGGMPIGAVVGKAHIMDAAAKGTVGGTYTGNPVACAAAVATIRRMEELQLNERAATIGGVIRQRLESLQSQCPAIVEVRGLGSMIAFELCADGDLDKPDAATTMAIVRGCQEQGLHIIVAGIHGNVIRILAPIVITDDQLERALSILESQVLSHTGAELGKVGSP